MINNVTLFDISGKLIAEKKKVNAQEVVLRTHFKTSLARKSDT
jgi:hypothetical protein